MNTENKGIDLLQDLHKMVQEKQERLIDVRAKLQKTNEEREAIRARLNAVSVQMEELTDEISKVHSEVSIKQTTAEGEKEKRAAQNEKKIMLDTVYEEDETTEQIELQENASEGEKSEHLKLDKPTVGTSSTSA